MNNWSVETEVPGVSQEADNNWDEIAAQDPRAGIMQCSAWAAFKTLEGYSARRIVVHLDNNVAGGGIFYCSPLGGFAICPQGPVFITDNHEMNLAALKLIVGEANAWSNTLGALGLRIEPTWEGNRPGMLRNWTRSPVDLTPIHTLVIDTAKDNNTLLAQMSPKGRYNIRLSQKKGITVRESCDYDDVLMFHELFIQTAARNQLFAEPLSFFVNLVQCLAPSNNVVVLLAEYDGEALAGAVLTRFGKRSTYLYGASGESRREWMPAYAVQWHSIQWSRAAGCTEYDLYGIDPFGHPNHLYAGITRFKKQFGGRSRDTIGAWDLINYKRLAESLVDQLGSIQNLEEVHS